MRSASAVTHQTSKSAMKLPASTIAGMTSASDAPPAYSAIATGQMSTKIMPWRIG